MADFEPVAYIVAAQAVGVLITTVVYSFLRLKKEERKAKAAEASAAANKQSFDAMVLYHSKRLDIEMEKLELARRNGKLPEVVTLSRPELDISSEVTGRGRAGFDR